MTLKELSSAISDKKYKGIPVHARPMRTYSDRNANELTKAIIAFLEFHNIKAWRQASEGRYIQGREYKDMYGKVRQEKGMYIPRSKAAKGIGDITATLPPLGRRLEIEVKHGRDKQSDAQKEFQKEIEAMGGIYMVVKTWDDFIFQIQKHLPK